MAGLTSSSSSSKRPMSGTKVVMTVAPLLLVILAAFVVVLNIRHYNGFSCESEDAREEALNRAALEKRVRAIELEVLENASMMEHFVRGMHDKVVLESASAEMDLGEMRRQARIDAETIQKKNGDAPPPPMPAAPAYMEAELAGGLQSVTKEIGEALRSSGSGDTRYMDPYSSGSGLYERGGWKNEKDGGWGLEWNPQQEEEGGEERGKKGPSASDEMPPGMALERNGEWGWGVEKGGEEEEDGEGVDEEGKRRLCNEWLTDYEVMINVDWGRLPYDLQQKWGRWGCDKLLKSLSD